MSDIDNLAAACLALPTDDLPKRILADCLEEGGDVWSARLIRLFCEAASGEGHTSSPPEGKVAALAAVRRLVGLGGGAWRVAVLALRRRLERFKPVSLDAVDWPGGWDAGRLHRAIAAAECRGLFASLGLTDFEEVTDPALAKVLDELLSPQHVIGQPSTSLARLAAKNHVRMTASLLRSVVDSEPANVSARRVAMFVAHSWAAADRRAEPGVVDWAEVSTTVERFIDVIE